MKTILINPIITVLHDYQDALLQAHAYPAAWDFKVIQGINYMPESHKVPNRRDFYKVMLLTRGQGILSIGLHTYYMSPPALVFVHPNDILSWKNLSVDSEAYYVLFKRKFVLRHPQLKAMLDRFGLFQNLERRVISLNEGDVPALAQHFELMRAEDAANNIYKEEAIQALLQLLIVDSLKLAPFTPPDTATEDDSHIHQFFELLELELAGINHSNPIRIKTVKEFAQNMEIHPNYLNALLKKHTGKKVSVLIRNRLLDEAKTLLLQTNWPVQEISHCIGFADQSNFNLFFKRNTGVTAADFRRTANN